MAKEEWVSHGEKKIKTEDLKGDKLGSTWNKIKSFDATLRAIKNERIEKHGRTHLGQPAKANKQGVAILLKLMGVQPEKCSCFLFWGAAAIQIAS